MNHALTKKLHTLADEKTAKILVRFFKTAPGEYGAGENFLTHHYAKLPRTTLRYAIERFPEPLRQDFLRGKNIFTYR